MSITKSNTRMLEGEDLTLTGDLLVDTIKPNTTAGLQLEGGDGLAMRRAGQTNSFVIRPLSGPDGDGIRFTQGGGAGDRMRIDSSGNLSVPTMAVGGTANLHWSSGNGQFFVTSSSKRFKHDIVDYDKGLAEVLQMQPKYFVYNDEPSQKQRAGFIAEDFHDIGMTEYVEYWKDENGEDTPSEIGYSNMVAVLVKSIQELSAKIETLETKVAALEA